MHLFCVILYPSKYDRSLAVHFLQQYLHFRTTEVFLTFGGGM
uniref:Uncharacterized protein n=1 Tax=Anguilla anguilla TaxID=7936 RepID=A0A0E9XJI4_ANGAN